MRLSRPFGLFGFLALCVVAFLTGSGCSDDRGAATSPAAPEGPSGSFTDGAADNTGLKISRQAHLWISFEGAESAYVEADANPWMADSWVTDAGAFDLVIQNNAKFATQDVVLLVTVPSKIVAIPGWSVTIDGAVLDAAAFTENDPSLYGFSGGSHGVFPPSGNGIYCHVPITDELAKKSSISVPVAVSSGGIPGFMIHFDVGSTELYNPASHDATVNLPDTPPPPPPLIGACCLPDFSCVELEQSNCELQGGTYHGDESLCTPDLCLPVPVPGACCMVSGSCLDLLQSDCELQNGLFLGEATVCGPSTCGE